MNELMKNGEGSEKTLEEMLTELDGLIGSMQKDSLSLEETFAGYKQGLELVRKCNEKIEKIECDIKLLDPAEEQ